jgi:hypothetical protein
MLLPDMEDGSRKQPTREDPLAQGWGKGLITHRKIQLLGKCYTDPRIGRILYNVSLDGKIILEWILAKWCGRLWTGFVWLRIQTSDGFL